MLWSCCLHPRLDCRHHRLLGLIIVNIVLLSFGHMVAVTGQQSRSSNVSSVMTTQSCDGVRQQISCKHGTVIYIANAIYGRISGTPCSSNPSTNRSWDLHCMNSAAYHNVSKACTERSRCSLSLKAEEFGLDCPSNDSVSADMGLIVNYTCRGLSMSTNPLTTAWWIARSEGLSRPPDDGLPTAGRELAPPLWHSSTSEPAQIIAVAVPPDDDVGSTHSHLRRENITDRAAAATEIQSTASGRPTDVSPAGRAVPVNGGPCPAESIRGVGWPATKPGHVRQVSCPPPAQGAARRLCGSSGFWQDVPDMSDCVSSTFAEVQAQLLVDGEPEQLVERVRNASSAAKLFGGDLRASVRILGNLSSSALMAESAAKDVVQTSSNLFSASHADAWRDLSPATRMETAAQLLAAVERGVAIAAKSLSSSQTIASDHAVCTIRVIQAEELAGAGDDIIISMDGTSDVVRFHSEAVAPLKTDDGSVKIVAILTDRVHTLVQGNTEPMEAVAAATAVGSTTATVSSRILSVTIAGHLGLYDFKSLKLNQPFVYILNHMPDATPSASGQRSFTCVFWDFHQRNWSGSGCMRIGGNATYSICECDHLTNFAVLMDVMGSSTKLAPAHEMSLKIITWVGCVVSIVCLILSWLTFQCLKSLNCDRNTIHKNLVFTLCLAEMLFLFGLSETGLSIPLMCTVVAALLHFLFLAAFGWMCLEGVQLYVMLIEVFETERSRIGYYYAAGYGIPAIIVGVSAGIDYNSYGTDKFCWLRADTGFIWSFVGPVAAVILVNLAMLGIAIHMMCRHASTAASIKAKDQKKSNSASCDPAAQLSESSGGSGVEHVGAHVARTLEQCGAWVKASAVLVVLLGLTWIFGFLYVNDETIAMAYVFTILNSLQGLFIFLFHCVCNDKVQKEYRKFVRRATWLPNCMRIQYGGHQGLYNTTSNSSGGSGHNNQSRLNSFKKMLISVRRKRASTTSTMQQSGSLPSAQRLTSTNGAAGMPEFSSFDEESAFEAARSSRQQLTTFCKLSAKDAYDGMNGELSYADVSVIDSECISDYAHYGLEQRSNNVRHYAVTCQQCGCSATRSDELDRLAAPCECHLLLASNDGERPSQRAGAQPCVVQPYDVGIICKQVRSQKGLSGRGLLQPESDEEDSQYLTPVTSSSASHGPLSSFGRRLQADDGGGGKLGDDPSTAFAGRADAFPAYGHCRPTWPARDNIVPVVDRPLPLLLRPTKLEPINEVSHL